MDESKDVAAVVIRCRDVLEWEKLETYAEYKTDHSLPLIVLDAVFSIRAKYDQVVTPLIGRYCEYVIRKGFADPRIIEQPVEQFVEIGKELTHERFAVEVLKNSQRTSALAGILKAEAAVRFAETLLDFGVHLRADVDRVKDSDKFCRWIKTIPGQNISLDYFLMMIGRDDLVKADTHVLAFLKCCIGREVTANDAFRLLNKATDELKRSYKQLTARVLDNMIWTFQRKMYLHIG